MSRQKVCASRYVIEPTQQTRCQPTGLTPCKYVHVLKAFIRYLYTCANTDALTELQAIQRMRELTDNGIPFSFEFISCNESNATSKGLVVVQKALLRINRMTAKDTSIAYTDLEHDEPRFFHLPLLTKFNGHAINYDAN